MKNNAFSLGTLLGLPGLDGSVAIAALSGLFKPENALMIAIIFLAGPGAILAAALLDGNAKERIFAALLAGIIATIIVMFAAAIGPRLLGLVNLRVIKIFGAIAIFSIALMVAGIKLPETLPMIIAFLGIIVAGVWK